MINDIIELSSIKPLKEIKRLHPPDKTAKVI